ncbi:Kdo hydroxylase family protein [Variovorax dokdonensis]|uniref:Kdo hydroxylase family protein n=1 Tax=Variovorax dokdonensis TaxID=344883 RepID=A0ABT7N8Y5_9BURK|nr:Kdo hydroxylase family protein [Variovorax dokdonensis]MDM0044330.1 Kdo hydroxylase family protein [Variovorax dokdonensis]
METQLVTIGQDEWRDLTPASQQRWIEALEAGKVLLFPFLGFVPEKEEQRLLDPAVLAKGVRNISLDAQGRIKGVEGEAAAQQAAADMIGRFRTQAMGLIDRLLPAYGPALRLAPTSFRPMQVEGRAQSWRADDRRLHVDAFPSRPNYGERILRVFTNLNPHGTPRVWRVGEPFEAVAKRFLPRTKAYSPWQAKMLHKLHVTKSLRSEYDHLMLQLHDGMKSDLDYQRECPQETVPFAPGSTWVCFSDQTSHAVMSGQFMMEQTLHLPVASQYNPEASPLGILRRLTGRKLI